MTEPLTKKQRETFNYLFEFEETNGYMPSIPELAEHFRISTTSAWERLHNLYLKGWIDKKRSKHRSIELIGV